MKEYSPTYSLTSSRSIGDEGYLVAIRQQLQSLGSIKNECDAREHTLQQVSNRVNELENLLSSSNDTIKEKVLFYFIIHPTIHFLTRYSFTRTQ